MRYFQVRYTSKVVIYERKMFIRLATGYSILMFRVKCVTTRLSRRPINKSIVKVWDGARNEGERYTWEWWVSEGVYTFLVCIRQSANRYVLVKWGYKVLMRVTPKVKVFCGWSCCCRRRRRLVEKNINWRKLRTWQKDYKRKKRSLGPCYFLLFYSPSICALYLCLWISIFFLQKYLSACVTFTKINLFGLVLSFICVPLPLSPVLFTLRLLVYQCSTHVPVYHFLYVDLCSYHRT